MENLPNELYHACRQNATMNTAAINLISAPKRVYCFSPLSFRLPPAFMPSLTRPTGVNSTGGAGGAEWRRFLRFCEIFGGGGGKNLAKGQFCEVFWGGWGGRCMICDRQSRRTGFARFWRQRQQAIRQRRYVMKYHKHNSFREIYLNKVVL